MNSVAKNIIKGVVAVLSVAVPVASAVITKKEQDEKISAEVAKKVAELSNKN